jgi:hypothetical protein
MSMLLVLVVTNLQQGQGEQVAAVVFAQRLDPPFVYQNFEEEKAVQRNENPSLG